MLVLSRRRTQKIVMPLTAGVLRGLVEMIPEGADNDDQTPVVMLTIVVAEIRDDKTRIGVEAPKIVPVHREEVYEQIKAQQPPPPASRSDSVETSEAKVYQDLADVIAHVDLSE